jgi:hypothetical protein
MSLLVCSILVLSEPFVKVFSFTRIVNDLIKFVPMIKDIVELGTLYLAKVQ